MCSVLIDACLFDSHTITRTQTQSALLLFLLSWDAHVSHSVLAGCYACVKQGQLCCSWGSDQVILEDIDEKCLELILRSLDFAISVKPSTVWDSFFSLNILFHSLNELLNHYKALVRLLYGKPLFTFMHFADACIHRDQKRNKRGQEPKYS